MLQYLLIFFGVALFGFLHSFMASLEFKRRLANVIGDKIAFYRMFFNIFSTILFFGILAVIPKPHKVIYDLQPPFDLIIFALQVFAFLGLAWTAKSFDLWEFVGVKQILRYYKGEYNVEELDETPDFRISGAFKCCRHPVYLFSILFIGLRPRMDETYLILFLAGTIYFIVGAYFEEKKLVKIYGKRYLEYKQSTPMFLPAFFLKRDKNKF